MLCLSLVYSYMYMYVYALIVCTLLLGGNKGIYLSIYNHLSIYYDPAIGYSITCVDRPRCWRVGQGLQMHFTLTTRVGICVR